MKQMKVRGYVPLWVLLALASAPVSGLHAEEKPKIAPSPPLCESLPTRPQRKIVTPVSEVGAVPPAGEVTPGPGPAPSASGVSDDGDPPIARADYPEIRSGEGRVFVERKYTGRLISLDLQDTDVDNALRIIAEVANLNIIADDTVSGKLRASVRLIDVPWDQALDVILIQLGLTAVQTGNVVRVLTVDQRKRELVRERKLQQALDDTQPLLTAYLSLAHSSSVQMKPLVEMVLTPRGRVGSLDGNNQLLVVDIARGVAAAREVAARMDTPSSKGKRSDKSTPGR